MHSGQPGHNMDESGTRACLLAWLLVFGFIQILLVYLDFCWCWFWCIFTMCCCWSLDLYISICADSDMFLSHNATGFGVFSLLVAAGF